jgi:hypothetical protein
MDFTAEDMSPSGAAAAAQRNKLRVQFYRKAVEHPGKSEEAGVPVYEDHIFVRKLVPGDPTSIVDTLAVIHKRHPNADNNLFPEQWAAFQRDESQETSGVPLSEFPALRDSERKTLAFLEVRTVEQLAELPDDSTSRLMGGNTLKRKAQDFLKARADSGHTMKLSAQLQKADEERASMQAQLSEMAAKLEALQKSDKSTPKK